MLPETLRAPFVLCCLEGKSKTEAAQELGWKPGTLSGRLAQARTRLRQRLARRGITLTATLTAVAITQDTATAADPATLVSLRAMVSAGESRVVSAKVLALAEGITRTVGLKLKLVAWLLFAGLLATGAGLFARDRLGENSAETVAAEAPLPALPVLDQSKEEAPKHSNDALGDPLPPGALFRLGTVRLRHGGLVFGVAFSPDGKTIASAGWSPKVRLWETATGKELRQFLIPQPKGAASLNTSWSVAISPDSKRLAAGITKGSVCLWAIATGKLLHELRGNSTAAVHAVAFSPDGKVLASGGRAKDEKGELLLWDVTGGKQVRSLLGHPSAVSALAFSPDGKLLGTGCDDGIARLWQVETGQSLRQMLAHKFQITSVAFSGDGKTLATGSTDWGVRLWQVTTGKLLRELVGHQSGVHAVAFSPDGKVLASGSDHARVRLWDPSTGARLTTISGPHGGVLSLAFSAKGKYLACGNRNGLVRLWQMPGSERLLKFQTSAEQQKAGDLAGSAWSDQYLLAREGHQGAIEAMDVSPDGKVIATASSDRSVRLWSATTGKPLALLYKHPDWVSGVCFSPNGRLLASSSNDQTVVLWDVNLGKELRRLKGCCVAFSPDGKTLATGGVPFQGVHGGLIRLYDVGTGKEIRQLHGHRGTVFSVAFSPDGKTLASGGMGIPRGLSVEGEVYETNTLRLWDVATGKERFQFGGALPYVYAVAFSRDGKMLASASGQRGSDNKSMLRLWEVATGKQRGQLEGHTDRVASVAFSREGKTLASASWDKTVRLWNLKTGKEVGRLVGHRSWATAVAFSPDGKRLISGSEDTTGLIWDVEKLLRQK
jgi:WD40 repeat protein